MSLEANNPNPILCYFLVPRFETSSVTEKEMVERKKACVKCQQWFMKEDRLRGG